MADRISSERRSALMGRIAGRHTRPELWVRVQLHRAGFRFRLHSKHLPGSPDIVLPRYRTAVYVHGCFWHGHHCRRGTRPTSNVEFWTKKLDANIRRDREAAETLQSLGWRVHAVWTCQLTDDTDRLIAELKQARRALETLAL